MIAVMGATKIEEALAFVKAILEQIAEEHPDTRVNDVAIVVDVSYDREKGGSTGKFVYACSDERPWFQEAIFRRAADASMEEPFDDDQ